jgi:hypothetical protein
MFVNSLKGIKCNSQGIYDIFTTSFYDEFNLNDFETDYKWDYESDPHITPTIVGEWRYIDRLSKKIVNGTRAIIEEINYPNILIKTIDNTLYNISYVKYINEFDNEIQYDYIPIKLAYAITIHKSQGQTLDYIEIDLGSSVFEYGMAYVALSRAKNLKSIYISNLSRNSFKVNNEVIEFYKNL